MTQRKVLLIDAGHQAFDELDTADLPGGGAVTSVNTQTGVVVLGASDVGAQPVDADLTAIAGLTSAADKGIQFTGSGTAGLFDLTTAGKALLDDAAASDQRTTLGLGTLATQSGTFSGTSSGTNTGDQTLPTRASLGLATSDTPQFAGIEVGAASDTTLARSGAGDLTVEGNAIYRAGGTDVPVADGGTGASTAADARTNLGLVIGTDVRAQGSGDPTVPAFATPSIALGTAAAAGAASTVIRSDATVLAFDATVPVTQASADAAATGSASVAARRDHKHGMPTIPAAAAGGTPATVIGTAGAAGVAGTFLRTDDTLGILDATVPTTSALGDAAATGSVAKAARRGVRCQLLGLAFGDDSHLAIRHARHQPDLHRQPRQPGRCRLRGLHGAAGGVDASGSRRHGS
jgi:hypothetical protein